jgi:hypothetical protein
VRNPRDVSEVFIFCEDRLAPFQSRCSDHRVAFRDSWSLPVIRSGHPFAKQSSRAPRNPWRHARDGIRIEHCIDRPALFSGFDGLSHLTHLLSVEDIGDRRVIAHRSTVRRRR